MSAFTLEAYAPAPETTDPRIPLRNRVVTRDLLDRVTVKAERAGIAVFTDVNDWLGKPVAWPIDRLSLRRLRVPSHDGAEAQDQSHAGTH